MSPSDLGTQSKDLFLLQEEEETVELPSGNDLAILKALADSFDLDVGVISFQGIRRKLGLHQETLSRSLRRLERDGLIDKQNHDYKISPKGTRILTLGSTILSHSPHDVLFPIPILRTILPPDTTESDLEKALSHKWFGNLRWFGSSHNEDGTVLSWTTEDGSMTLSARISDGYLGIESLATTKESMETAIRAAYEIFDHVSKVFKYNDMLPMRERNSPTVYRAA